jgi:hypothetical protein
VPCILGRSSGRCWLAYRKLIHIRVWVRHRCFRYGIGHGPGTKSPVGSVSGLSMLRHWCKYRARGQIAKSRGPGLLALLLQEFYRRHAWYVSLLAVVLMTVGCSRTPHASEVADSITTHVGKVQPSIEWDAGIVVPGKRTSIVFPLMHAEIDSLNDIQAIVSSCPCLKAEACDYIDSSGNRRPGIWLTIREEEPVNIRAVPGSLLAIELKIVTKAGSEITRTVRLLISGFDAVEIGET